MRSLLSYMEQTGNMTRISEKNAGSQGMQEPSERGLGGQEGSVKGDILALDNKVCLQLRSYAPVTYRAVRPRLRK